MELNSYPSGPMFRTAGNGISRSLNSLSSEIDNGGHRNPAFEDDTCDSIGSCSSSRDSESSDGDDDRDETSEKTPYQSIKEPRHYPSENVIATARSRAKWDVFQVSSEDNISGSVLACWNACFLFTRTTFCFVLFIVVFVMSMLSKFTFLTMTSNIFPPSTENGLKTLGGTLSYADRSWIYTDIRWIWGILIAISAPYLFTVLKYTWILLFRKTWPMQWSTLLAVFCLETLHSIGLCIFALVVLPSFDPLTACVLCFSISLVPGILKIIFPSREPKEEDSSSNHFYGARVVNTFAVLCQIGSIGLWSYYVFCSKTKNSVLLMALMILSPILVSFSWWENFVSQSMNPKTSSMFSFSNLKKRMKKERVRIGIITNLWKIILTIIIMPSLLIGARCENGAACIKTFFFQSVGKAEYTLTDSTNFTVDGQYGKYCVSVFPFIISMVNVLSNIICYKCAKIASKIMAQKLCFALPIIISTPGVLGIFFGIYSKTLNFGTESCIFPLPHWLNENADPSLLFEYVDYYWPALLAGILGFLSFLLISNHIWSPNEERLIPTDRLFVRALYSGAFLDQSLLLNRRRIDKELKQSKHKKKENEEVPIPDASNDNSQGKDQWSAYRKDDTPMIYMCATMWHESEKEMVQILKSIFRQDIDQCSRHNLQSGLGIKDPDYYEFQAHIFFDDAFESRMDSQGRYKVNSYVKQLVESIDIASRSIYSEYGKYKIPPPIRTNTPYGGRLEWKLRGGNTLTAHLKDKTKIRHRKRWSQVMYMYYFMAYKFMNMSQKTRKQKRTIAENTFLLALDGDVDFQPKAVQLLVDRMRKNPNVGAACGRIHPIGSGPMVWYQKFEYAISHWLQKAAENVLGCVLCSPGCFSLFRGSALMDDNVMARYTTCPTEPLHYVQYDQGEDRWLCTLLLQQGYKVEYVAASDALTYAPEGFYEFYNQRRRWSPSTMANIMDLLMDWKNVIRKNEDISMLYIMYQMFLMVCSILTPGTIFLMILGAISMAFPAIPPSAGMVINLAPVMGMVILCFIAKSETQLAYAAVVSTIYSLLMMVVLVGLMVEAVTAGFCSVTTLFLLFVVGVFFVSAVIHPQEFFCVLHGFLYFLSIPSMSMLLMIYSLGNLHVVSWGTRETKDTEPQQSAKTVNKEPDKTKSQTILESLGFGTNDRKSDYIFSCGNFIRCCPARRSDEKLFNILLDRLDDIEAQIKQDTQDPEPEDERPAELHFTKQDILIDGAVERSNPAFHEEMQPEIDEHASWINDEDLKDGAIDLLDKEETEFWQDFIEKYLKPLNHDKEHQKQMHQGLLELRNKVCLAFLLMNALFVTIVYVLTEVNSSTHQTLSIKLPCTVSEGRPGRGYIEPISFAFTAIFGIMLFLQFICMLMHRMSTFIHIAASTNLDLKKRLLDGFNSDEQKPQDIGVEEGLEIVKGLQKEKDDDNISLVSQDTAYSGDSYTRSGDRTREMWKRYTRRLREKTSAQPQELRLNFAKNLEKFSNALDEGDDASTRGMPEESNANIHDVKISKVQTVFRNRFNTKTLHAVRTIAENSVKAQEIKRRATALKQRDKIKSRWIEIREKTKLQLEAENGERNGRTSKVGFASVAKVAVAREKRKHLEENDETSLQNEDEIGERTAASSTGRPTLDVVVENDLEEKSLKNEDSKKEEQKTKSFPPEHQESGQESNVESINL